VEVGDLSPRRTVYTATSAGRDVVHLSARCGSLQNANSVRRVDAGAYWDTTPVCSRCIGSAERYGGIGLPFGVE